MSFPQDNSGFPFGLPQPGLDVDAIEPLSPVAWSGTAVVEANALYLLRFAVPRPMTFTTVTYSTGSPAAGNVDAGVYEDPLGDASHLSLMASAGSTAVGSAFAIQNLTLAAPVSLSPGTNYYLAIAFDDDTTQAVGSSVSSDDMAVGNRFLYAAHFPLPAAITDAAQTRFLVWMMLRNV